jgi:hypothetical protein
VSSRVAHRIAIRPPIDRAISPTAFQRAAITSKDYRLTRLTAVEIPVASVAPNSRAKLVKQRAVSRARPGES